MQKRARPKSSRSSRTIKLPNVGALPAQATTSRRSKKDADDIAPVDPRRSALMARVRQRHSEPEQAVRRALRALKISHRLHLKSLPGTPDIVVPSRKTAILVHGCFWHRHLSCVKASTPKIRVAFWTEKFAKNVERDARKARALRKLGWSVLTVWECQIKDDEKLLKRLKRLLTS